MDKQFNINDLLNSNFLAAGGLLQIDPDQFIILIGKKRLFQGHKSPDSSQVLVYNPQFWDFLKDSKVSENALYEYDQQLHMGRAELIEALSKAQPAQPIKAKANHRANFEKQYLWSQQYFKNQTLQKTVPITKFEYGFQEKFNFAIQLLKALENQSYGYLYGEWTVDSGFLGMTPEVLAEWDGEKLSTMALAGTWGVDKNYLSVLDVDQKTKHEHQFVIDDISQRLHLTEKKETEILKLPTLSHLKTEMSKACLSKELFLQDVYKLHPTAALGLYPRDKDLALMFSNLELQNERQFFGAPFGVIGTNFARVIVSIRNFVWSNTTQTLNIFAGCGITSESQFEQEWQELHQKKNAIVKAFSLQIESTP